MLVQLVPVSLKYESITLVLRLLENLYITNQALHTLDELTILLRELSGAIASGKASHIIACLQINAMTVLVYVSFFVSCTALCVEVSLHINPLATSQHIHVISFTT